MFTLGVLTKYVLLRNICGFTADLSLIFLV
jgi:hypothetical protein